MSASLNSTNSGAAAPSSTAERPWRIAHSFPVQPGARLVPATIRSRSAAPAALAAANAAAAVPSALWSSTTTTENGPRIVLPEEGADAIGDHVGLVAGRNDRHDGGPESARSESTSLADGTESSRSPPSQNHPLPNRR